MTSASVEFRPTAVCRRVFHAMAAPFKSTMEPEVASAPACGKSAPNAAMGLLALTLPEALARSRAAWRFCSPRYAACRSEPL